MPAPSPSSVLAALAPFVDKGDDTPGWWHDHNPITAWFGIGDGAWCAMCVSYGLVHGGFSADGGQTIDLPDPDYPHGWAYVPDLVIWARAHGLWREPPTPPQAGWSIVYHWPGGDPNGDHVGFVVADGFPVHSLEGNRPDHLEGESAYELAFHLTGPGGDAPTSTILGFVAWPYPPSPPATVVPAADPLPAPTVLSAFHDQELGALQNLIVPVRTDNDGNGATPPGSTDVWDAAKVISVCVEGSDPFVDKAYWAGVAHWQPRDGHPMITVTGCAPGATVNVIMCYAT